MQMDDVVSFGFVSDTETGQHVIGEVEWKIRTHLVEKWLDNQKARDRLAKTLIMHANWLLRPDEYCSYLPAEVRRDLREKREAEASQCAAKENA